MNQRFNQTTGIHSIFLLDDGFSFGINMFRVTASQLNKHDAGFNYYAGDTSKGYDIPLDSSGKSSLTGEAGCFFTPVELEVFKVLNY